MGSTVSTGKLVAAFNDAKGKTFYVLFEETYEKNVHPHTPRWDALALGDLAAIMRIIFRNASSCEGGMLKGAGGRDITPEGYIGGWLRELENPVHLADSTYELAIAEGWSSMLTRETFEQLKPRLEAIGAHEMIRALDAGEAVKTSLYADAESLAAIFDGSTVGAWRLIKHTPLYAGRNAELGYSPRKAKALLASMPHFMKIDPKADSILKLGEDNCWRNAGWGYSIVAEFVSGLWEAELQAPGNYRARIKVFRDSINNAPSIPAIGVKIVIDTQMPVKSWEQSNIKCAVERLGGSTQGDKIELPVPTNFNDLYLVTSLPAECAQWVFAEPAPFEQLDLLAS